MMKTLLAVLLWYGASVKWWESFLVRLFDPFNDIVGLLADITKVLLGFKFLREHNKVNINNPITPKKQDWIVILYSTSNKSLWMLYQTIFGLKEFEQEFQSNYSSFISSRSKFKNNSFFFLSTYHDFNTSEIQNRILQSISTNLKMKPQSKLSLKSKLTCMNEKHKDEQIKIVCLSPTCGECPLLCSVCLTEFTHEKCKYNLITVKQLEKKDLWKMDNWPTRPEHFDIKERLRKYDDLIELDELIESISIDLKEKVNRAIDELKQNAKSRYRLLIEKRQYDIEPLREIYFQAYNVDVVQKIVNDIITWRKNIYQGIQALQEFKKNQDRTLAIKELDILITNGKFPDIPTVKVAERAFKVILWQLQNLPKEIFGEKRVTNTLQFLKETIEDDDGIYEGETCNGKKHGQGKYYFKNGNVYEGEMFKGVMQGRGKYTWANQNVYEGTFVQDKMSGNGKLSFANGDVYEGEFINNRACGNGKMVAHNGQAYEGQFMNNLKQGKGKQYLKNGNVYEGEFYEGKWHGRGKILFPDATIDEGIWLQNSKQ